jgi:hypothetical protein
VRLDVPPSLTATIADQLATLPAETRSVLEMLAVVNARLPLARLGSTAGVASPSAAVEPAVAAGLVDWWPREASCPVALRHALQRDAIYAGLAPTLRRALHARRLQTAMQNIDSSYTFAIVVVLAIVGLLLSLAGRKLRDAVIRWDRAHEKSR